MRCNRSPVLDPEALAKSLETNLNADVLHLRIAAQEAARDLRCIAEVCPRIPRKAFTEAT